MHAGPLVRILQKNVEFQWETEEQTAMAILEEALCNAPGLITLGNSDGAWQIVVGVDTRSEGLGVILQQGDENKNRHPCHYENGRWIKDKKSYDEGKRECHGLVKALKNFGNDGYGVRFLVEIDATTLVHQLNLPTNKLPGATVPARIA